MDVLRRAVIDKSHEAVEKDNVAQKETSEAPEFELVGDVNPLGPRILVEQMHANVPVGGPI